MLKEIRRALDENGWVFVRRGKGSHEIWRHPNGRQMPIPTGGAPDTGRRRTNLLHEIRRHSPGQEDESPEMEETIVINGDEIEASTFARSILEDAGAAMGRWRRSKNAPLWQIVSHISPEWTHQRLLELEACDQLPLKMTAEEFLGWCIGVSIPEDVIQELLDLLTSSSQQVFIEKAHADVVANDGGNISVIEFKPIEDEAIFNQISDRLKSAINNAANALNAPQPHTAPLIEIDKIKQSTMHLLKAPTPRELIDLRNDMNLSQAEMAYKLGMPRSSYAALEVGRRAYPKGGIKNWRNLRDKHGKKILPELIQQSQPIEEDKEMTANNHQFQASALSIAANNQISHSPEKESVEVKQAIDRKASIDRIVKILSSHRITDEEVVKLEEKLKANFMSIIMEELV